MKKWVLIMCCVLGFSMALPAQASAEPIIVGCANDFPPFDFMENGRPAGFDIELWQAVAKEARLDYEFKPMVFKDLIPALQSGEIDAAVAGMTITSAREEKIDFSHPYFSSGLKIMVRRQSGEKDIHQAGDLRGRAVATKEGTTSEAFLKEIGLQPDTYTGIQQAIMALEADRVEAVVFDAPSLAYYANNQGLGKVVIVGPLYKPQSYGVAFPQGSELREVVSRVILMFLEDGTIDKLSKKWFGPAVF